MTSVFSCKTLLTFALLHSVHQGQICLLLQVFFDFLLLHSSPHYNKGHRFWVLVLKGIVGLHRTIQLQLLQCYWLMKEELPRSVGAQYATGDQWRNNSRKNEGMEPKHKQHPVVDGTGNRSKVQCCKEQYCIGTWNVRSMNQGKLEVVKQEVARVNIDILGIWTKMEGNGWI